MEYELIKSNRKTISLQIKENKLIVRAPLRMQQKDIDEFINSHIEWINKNLSKSIEKQNRAEEIGKLSEEDISRLYEKAKYYFPKKVEYYAKIIGVTYGRITIRKQQTLWGSCTSKGNLSFNCLLMLTPPEVIDSIIVHELCHRKEMNHSKNFYAEVYKAYPEYDKWNSWLKDNGGIIMSRAK